jgi:hypothetical protein
MGVAHLSDFGHNPIDVKTVLRMPDGHELRNTALRFLRRLFLEWSAEPAGGVERVAFVVASVHAQLNRVFVLVLGLANPLKVMHPTRPSDGRHSD